MSHQRSFDSTFTTQNKKGVGRGSKKRLYRGFSTYEFERNNSFKIYDVDCVKLDLLNHIFTRRGDRLMMPTFGTLIPDIIFEPLDVITTDQVRDELTEVFEYDPRVELMDLNVDPDYDNNTIIVRSLLRYIELNVTEGLDFNIDFEGLS